MSNAALPILNQYLDAARLIDRQTAESIDIIEQETGARPGCGGIGCTACCRMSVGVTYPEIDAALKMISNRDMLRVFDALAAAFALALTPGLDGDDWLEHEIDCVFLVDGRCSVYERRPLKCREYVSYDRSTCGIPRVRTPHIKIKGLAAHGLGSMIRLAQRNQQPAGLGPLPVMLWVALMMREDPDAGRREAKKLGVDTLEASARWEGLA